MARLSTMLKQLHKNNVRLPTESVRAQWSVFRRRCTGAVLSLTPSLLLLRPTPSILRRLSRVYGIGLRLVSKLQSTVRAMPVVTTVPLVAAMLTLRNAHLLKKAGESIMNILKIVLVGAALAVLSGCSLMEPTPVAKPVVAKPGCHQWCHNGWCTTHCDEIVTAG
jgi:hypothetical protein